MEGLVNGAVCPGHRGLGTQELDIQAGSIGCGALAGRGGGLPLRVFVRVIVFIHFPNITSINRDCCSFQGIYLTLRLCFYTTVSL